MSVGDGDEKDVGLSSRNPTPSSPLHLKRTPRLDLAMGPKGEIDIYAGAGAVWASGFVRYHHTYLAAGELSAKVSGVRVFGVNVRIMASEAHSTDYCSRIAGPSTNPLMRLLNRHSTLLLPRNSHLRITRRLPVLYGEGYGRLSPTCFEIHKLKTEYIVDTHRRSVARVGT